jgi:hypothetical protein
MRCARWLLVLVLVFGTGVVGCFNSSSTKPPSPEQQKKIDDDMKKAIEQNKGT